MALLKHPLDEVWTVRSLCCRPWRLLWIHSHFWMTGMLCKAAFTPLESQQVWDVPQHLRAAYQGERFESLRRRKPQQRLACALIELYWPQWVHAGSHYLIWCCCAGAQPFLVKEFLRFLASPGEEFWYGLILVGIFGLTLVGYLYAINIKFSLLVENGVAMRSGLVVALSEKSLRLGRTASNDEGAVTNIMSNDTEAIFEMQLFLHYLWASVAFVIIVTALIVREIGPAGLVGFALLLLTMPLQASLGKCTGVRKRRMLGHTDARTGFLSEVLHGIEIVKLCAWEDPFAARLELTRRAELRELTCALILRAIMRTTNFLLAPIVGFVTLWAYASFGNELTLETSFMVLSFINILRFPLLLIPHAVALLAEGLVSIQRIESFLVQPEHEHVVVVGGDDDEELSGATTRTVVFRIDAATIDWGGGDAPAACAAAAAASSAAAVAADSPSQEESCEFVLRDIRFSVHAGALVGVVGAVGSGKTTLLHACLGEMRTQVAEKRDAAVDAVQHFGGAFPNATGARPIIAFQSQASPISNSSLAENIRFGLPLDECTSVAHCVALWAACLVDDVLRLPAGLQSEIGERGVNISGGQQARVAFARVIFSLVWHRLHFQGDDHDGELSKSVLEQQQPPLLVVLDDPLSAVDIDVAHTMFRRGVMQVILQRTEGGSLPTRDTDDFERLASVVGSKEIVARALDFVRRESDTENVDAPQAGVLLVLSAHTELLNSSAASSKDSIIVLAQPNLDQPSCGSISAHGSYAEVSPSFPSAISSDDGDDGASAPPGGGVSAACVFDACMYVTVCDALGMVKICARVLPPALRIAAHNAAAVHDVSAELEKRDALLLMPSSTDDAAGGITDDNVALRKNSNVAAKSAALTAKEDRQHGRISCSTLIAYFAYGALGTNENSPGVRCWKLAQAIFLAGVLIGVLALAQVFRMLVDVWISWWSDPSNERSNSVPASISAQHSSRGDPFWAWGAVAWASAALIISFLRALVFVAFAVRSSAMFHTRALRSVLDAPLLWFQQNPSGRILNRFSTDLHRIDFTLPDSLEDFGVTGLQCAGAFALAFVSVPWIIAVGAVALPLWWLCQRLYRGASRELVRLDGTSRSLVYSLFSRIALMRSTIRAFHNEAAISKLCVELVDENAKVYLMVKMLERWISVHLNLVCVGVIVSLMVAATVLREGEFSIDPSVTGLAIVYTLQLMGLCSWFVRSFTRVENIMTCVERLNALAETPPAASIVTSKGPPASAKTLENWPSAGAISFENVRLRYQKHLPWALDRLSFSVAARQKVGICGRTGAGKSSVAVALFRLFECEQSDQEEEENLQVLTHLKSSGITIDGVDIATVPLSILRSRISCIPQTSVLFRGTVRSNIDPLGACADNELWDALRKAQLDATVRSSHRGLDSTLLGGVGDAGKETEETESSAGATARTHTTGALTLSHGQRQLLCICRAMLQRSTILVCDEATSSVDTRTDSLIQQIVRTEFVHCTVITIAHRLDTIMDCDLILVMDNGRCVESGSPEGLRADPRSRFAEMLAKRG